MGHDYSLMIHGGAGRFANADQSAFAEAHFGAMREVLELGRRLLAAGAPALDAVEQCVAALEDDPRYNAGHGAVLTRDGRVELDAGIMDGATLRAGAVAGLRRFANPVRIARAVMERTAHVLLIGDGADAFARAHGFAVVDEATLTTAERRRQLNEARATDAIVLDHDTAGDDPKLGTVGAVARDLAGHLAAATSTGGATNKLPGRVGDSPLVGAGVFADDESCAISATGIGEDFIRTVLAKEVAAAIDHRGLTAAAAVDHGLGYLRRRVAGCGGLILIDRDGRCASGATTPRMIHGRIERGGEARVSF